MPEGFEPLNESIELQTCKDTQNCETLQNNGDILQNCEKSQSANPQNCETLQNIANLQTCEKSQKLLNNLELKDNLLIYSTPYYKSEFNLDEISEKFNKSKKDIIKVFYDNVKNGFEPYKEKENFLLKEYIDNNKKMIGQYVDNRDDYKDLLKDKNNFYVLQGQYRIPKGVPKFQIQELNKIIDKCNKLEEELYTVHTYENYVFYFPKVIETSKFDFLEDENYIKEYLLKLEKEKATKTGVVSLRKHYRLNPEFIARMKARKKFQDDDIVFVNYQGDMLKL